MGEPGAKNAPHFSCTGSGREAERLASRVRKQGASSPEARPTPGRGSTLPGTTYKHDHQARFAYCTNLIGLLIDHELFRVGHKC